MYLDTLPDDLEDVELLIKRRDKAKTIKEQWRSFLVECYYYAMPHRETFSWQTEGTKKNNQLFDSTLQECTYAAANTLIANLFPAWQRWMTLAPGGAIPKNHKAYDKIVAGLQADTETFFSYLNSSNFGTVIAECALDLMIGTGSISFDEGDNDNPFMFSSIALSAIEIEEGPKGSVETTWMCRKPKARHLTRLYEGLTEDKLSAETQQKLKEKPDDEIEVIQGEIYDPQSKSYYGCVIELAAKKIIWRYNYGPTSPTIVARASKVAGETYGRGRVMLALADAKTLDKMVELSLKAGALSLQPPMTAVSDGVLNPYTAVIKPNVILPVASNDNGNPSIRPLPVGENFQSFEKLIEMFRATVRRTTMGPEPSEGAVRSATEVDVNDRNRLWALNGDYMRIQAELLTKIVVRGVAILQRKGLMQKYKLDGRAVSIAYTSPFAKSQGTEDVMNIQKLIATVGPGALGTPTALQMGINMDKLPGYVARKLGIDQDLIRSEDDQKDVLSKMVQAGGALQQTDPNAQPQQGAPSPIPQQAAPQ